MKIARVALAAVLLFLSGCSGLPWAGNETEAAPPTLTAGVTVTSTPAGNSSTSTPVEQTATPPDPTLEQATLLVWLPPEFDPVAGTPAGNLLRLRLNQFASLRTGLRIEVRIKAIDGPGGMLDALAAANAAAPLALPDLVALPRPLLEEAAIKGLLRPMDDLAPELNDPDWYDYARQLSRLQNSVFGIPFCGDALLMVYNSEAVPEAPLNWEKALTTPGPMAFPAADARAIHTLQLYLSAGGEVQDDQGRPMLDQDVLLEVYTYYQQAETAGLMPYWLTQYENDEQSWKAFADGQANLAITWTSRWLRTSGSARPSASPVPTPTGVPYTLASGWLWAMAGVNASNQPLAAELAKFLTEAEFMARWTQAAGYLPTRASALADWTNTPAKMLAGQVILSAHIIPSADVLSSLASILRDSTILILKEQGDPATLSEAATQSLGGP